MRTINVTALSILLALVLAAGTPRSLRAQDTTGIAPSPVAQLLARVAAANHSLDSLSTVADTTTGEQRAVLEEHVWQLQLAVQTEILEASTELEKLKARGSDVSAARDVLQDALASGWPRYRGQLERRERMLRELFERRDAATPQQRLEIETEFAGSSGRLARMYRDLVDALLAVERVGVDVGAQRSFIADEMSRIADQTQVRMVVLGRTNALAVARAQRMPDDADAQIELEAASAAFKQTMDNFETEISLLKRLGKDVTDLKVALIVARGTLTSAIFEPGVIGGLFRYWRNHFVETLVTRGPRWLFEGLMVVLIVAGFGLLARVTRSLVRRAVRKAGFSQLLKETVVMWSSRLVLLVGFLFLLKQFGVQLGPMLAGLGIAGLALGFALQDTLSNFAAGAMILAYHPYDVGDTVEVGGAMGIVQNMSLVSTTILTFDNQTLIVPNKKMWGDVIRNFTSQDKRRVDLMFAAGYENDITVVERILKEIADADARVLKDPSPVIKLHQLADSSINFVVRVWTRQDNYWDVYWDITRAVKLRFDQEGIQFPQRELNVSMSGGRPEGPP